MKRIAGAVVLLLWSGTGLFADALDSAVFRTRMLPENEVPSLSLPGTSASARIIVRAVRDGKGALTAATVVFDLDYVLPQKTTLVGLHIHNAPAGVTGSVVINAGLSGTNSISATSGHLTRVVNYSSTDTTALGFVSGLLSKPELYYVNMHSTDHPGGFIRGQLRANTLSFRPALSPANEVSPVTDVDAQATALITLNVNRDDAGKIVSGAATFDVDYQFPGSVTIVGMHIHHAAAGVNGPVVISSGIANPITNSRGRGTIFRIAEIPGTDATGLAALEGLMTNPSEYYVNIHTSTHPAGVMRGQLQKDVLTFLSHLRGNEEVPPVSTSGSADVLTTVRVSRNDAGNITGGKVDFAASYRFDAAVTLVGFHIHNGNIGVSGPVVISSGLGGGDNSVTSQSGSGSFTREVSIDSSNTTALSALNGLFVAPRSYYVNIHTAVNPAGTVRAQLAHETYHLRPIMSSANELAAVKPTASGTSWLTFTVNRDANGAIAAGTVTFDVDCDLDGPATVAAMHIHRGTAKENGPVVIGSGISPTVSTGKVNITATVAIGGADPTALGALAGLTANPGGYYLNLHTDGYPAGLMRSQLLPYVSFEPQVAGGGQWVSSITIANPSATSAAHGLIEVFDRNGDPMRPDIIDPTIPFLIPPSGSATFSTYNRGSLADGYARVHSSISVESSVGYAFDGLPGAPSVSGVVGSAFSIPVNFESGGIQNTGIALLDLDSTPPVALLTLRDSAGALVPGGIGAVSFSSGKRVVGLLNELLPPAARLGPQFAGTLSIELRYGPFGGGQASAIAIQFDGANVTPVAVSVIR